MKIVPGPLRLAPSRTRACSPCSTPSSTTCRRRSTSRRCTGDDPDNGKEEVRTATRRRAVRRARLQDHDRPVRRHAHVPPRLLRRARAPARTSSTRTKGQARSASAASSRCTRTSARRSRRSTPATSCAAVGLRDATTGDTLCDEDKPIVLECDAVPRAGHLDRDRAEDEGRPGEARRRARRSSRARIRRSASRPTRRPGRRSSPAWASSTSRSSSTASRASSRSTRTSASRRSRTARRSARRSSTRRKFVRQTGGRGQYGHVRAHGRAATARRRLRVRRRHEGRRRSRASSSRRSRRASKRRSSPACSPAIPWSTSRSTVTYGSYHEVDSSEMAFKIAGSMGFKEAAREGGARPARADHGGRGGGARRLHGRRHRRPQLPPRPDQRAWSRAAARR